MEWLFITLSGLNLHIGIAGAFGGLMRAIYKRTFAVQIILTDVATGFIVAHYTAPGLAEYFEFTRKQTEMSAFFIGICGIIIVGLVLDSSGPIFKIVADRILKWPRQ